MEIQFKKREVNTFNINFEDLFNLIARENKITISNISDEKLDYIVRDFVDNPEYYIHELLGIEFTFDELEIGYYVYDNDVMFDKIYNEFSKWIETKKQNNKEQ